MQVPVTFNRNRVCAGGTSLSCRRMPDPRPRPSGADYRRRRLVAGLAVLVTAIALGIVIAGAQRAQAPAERIPRPMRPTGAEATATAPEAPSAAAPQEAASGGPVSTGDWKKTRDPVPMLMYHDVEAATADAPLPELHVDEDDFRDQMKWLADNGYTGVTMEQVVDAWYQHGVLRRRSRWSSPSTTASSPTTRSPSRSSRTLGWPGVINLQAYAPKGLPEDAPLAPDRVKDLLAAGWELASHSITHPDLTTVDAEQLASEVEKSKRGLERQFGVKIEPLLLPGRASTTTRWPGKWRRRATPRRAASSRAWPRRMSPTTSTGSGSTRAMACTGFIASMQGGRRIVSRTVSKGVGLLSRQMS